MYHFHTSLLSNFFAKDFKVLPQKPYVVPVLDQLAANCLSDHIETDSKVWLFGLSDVSLSIPCEQFRFDYPDLSSVQDIAYTPLIPDSWFDTVTLLRALEKTDKPLVLIIAVDFLATLSDVRPLMMAAKLLLLAGNTSCFFLFQEHAGYLRSWSLEGFQRLLVASGFELASDHIFAKENTVIKVRCERPQYDQFLSHAGLFEAAGSSHCLLISVGDFQTITPADKDFDVKNIMQIRQDLVCLTDNYKYKNINQNRFLLLQELVGNVSKNDVYEGTALVEAIKVTLYLLPQLSSIEIYNEGGIAFRVIQAQRTGQLPHYLNIKVTTCSSIDYSKARLHNRNAMDYQVSELRNLVKDAYIFKYADVSYFRSQKVVDTLKQDFGYSIRNPLIRSMPVAISGVPILKDDDFIAPKVIIILGNPENDSDWQSILVAIKQLSITIVERQVKEIVILTKGQPSRADLMPPSRIVKTIWQPLDSIETIALHCEKSRSDGLFIIQTSSDEFFDALKLIQLYGCRFLTFGDLKPFFNRTLNTNQSESCQPNVEVSLSRQLLDALVDDTKNECSVAQKLQKNTLADQSRINQSYTDSAIRYSFKSQLDANQFLDITVVSPVFNTPIEYLVDLLDSLLVSTIAPIEWILINDGSSAAYVDDLNSFVSKSRSARLGIRLITQKNAGLAAARNTGLRESRSKYTYFLDSDDVFLAHTLADAAVAMQVDPSYVAVSGFPIYFVEKSRMPELGLMHSVEGYWPSIGVPENRVLGLLENNYLCATGLFNTAVMLKAGGWDDSDKSTWEDWAVYNKLAWNNSNFSVIPHPGFLYRNTPGSMAKTYNPYFGRRRLVRNLPIVNKFDAHVLFELVNQTMTQSEHLRILNMIYESRSWRITKPLRILLRLLHLDFHEAYQIYKSKDK